MLEVYGLTLSSLDEGLRHLTVLDLGVSHTTLTGQEAGEGGSRYIHRGEVLHAVATMDIECPAGGTKAVGGVDITTMLEVVLQAPVPFVGSPEGL